MNHWIPAREIEIPSDVKEAIGGHPLVAQTLFRRGLTDLAAIRGFLDPQAYQPASPMELPGMAEAVERIHRAIRAKETICVWGDFDVDGQTSTTVLVSALSMLGGKVIFHIPNRKNESHGVNLPYLKRMIESGATLIVTCDTGISAVDEVAYAQNAGVDVVVTDHHDLPESLPQARALVNPKMLPRHHPLATLPGVGVAYKLAEALFQYTGDNETYASFLDLVALGLVADLALLTGDARYLLQKGLQTLRQNQRLGLQVMLDIADIAPELISEEHIAFELAPRLNAMGRLSDANDIVEFFTTGDIGKARTIAYRLELLNEQRKLETNQVFQAAQAQIKSSPELLQHSVLVLSHPTWPAGIVGIVASRLVERYQKPTLLIATPFGEAARGSARSIEGINITAAIAAQKQMLSGFGGHPMAAGLAFPPSADIESTIKKFRKAISRTVDQMAGDIPQAQRTFDGYFPLENLTLALVEDFERLAPFGAGNPALTLVSPGMEIAGSTPIGKTQEHLRVSVKDSQQNEFQLIWWQGAGWPLPEGPFDLVYQARSTNFAGRKKIQCEWVDSKPPDVVAIDLSSKKAFDLIDCRSEANPILKLQQMQKQAAIQIWSEGKDNPPQSKDRLALVPADWLAIWSTPPGWVEMRAVIAAVYPKTIVLFAVNPGADSLQDFIDRLAGLIKFAINHYHGVVSLAQLAAKTAHREVTVRTGVAWLQAAGYFHVRDNIDSFEFSTPGPKKSVEDLNESQNRLLFLINETAAFRKMFENNDCDTLRPNFIA